MLPAEGEAFLAALGEKPYRARQVLGWIHVRRARSFEEMTDLSRALRAKLREAASLSVLEARERREAEDGTVKILFHTRDGCGIEAVLMRRDRFRAACLSTQVGCPLACGFCATGRAGFVRNLNPEEIVAQFLELERLSPSGKPLTHVVLMGMGEPLLNYDAVARAVRVLTHPDLRAMSPSRITLSTAGIVEGLIRLAGDDLKVNVALSLNATSDELRRCLMPKAGARPLDEVLGAFMRVPASRRSPRTLEYVLLAGVNDRDADARELALIARRTKAKVNLIPFNEVEGIPYRAPGEDAVERFLRVLSGSGITATVRRSRGAGIGAACGQLAGGSA